jgi:hypothetical protein
MSRDHSTRRDVLLGAGALASLGAAVPVAAAADAGKAAVAPAPAFAPDFPGKGQAPWIRRIFHLYTGPDGLTRAEQLPVTPPSPDQAAQLLRRLAHRVTIGASPAGHGWTFHVANQPTLLIPIFGSLVIGLHDGTKHEFGHGDMAFAEDCTGKGHISYAGDQGALTVQVQLPKELCPASGSSDMSKFWRD